jgi:hypothetical protein
MTRVAVAYVIPIRAFLINLVPVPVITPLTRTALLWTTTNSAPRTRADSATQLGAHAAFYTRC